jgi:hypothetical protein
MKKHCIDDLRSKYYNTTYMSEPGTKSTSPRMMSCVCTNFLDAIVCLGTNIVAVDFDVSRCPSLVLFHPNGEFYHFLRYK